MSFALEAVITNSPTLPAMRTGLLAGSSLGHDRILGSGQKNSVQTKPQNQTKTAQPAMQSVLKTITLRRLKSLYTLPAISELNI